VEVQKGILSSMEAGKVAKTLSKKPGIRRPQNGASRGGEEFELKRKKCLTMGRSKPKLRGAG